MTPGKRKIVEISKPKEKADKVEMEEIQEHSSPSDRVSEKSRLSSDGGKEKSESRSTKLEEKLDEFLDKCEPWAAFMELCKNQLWEHKKDLLEVKQALARMDVDLSDATSHLSM